MKHTPGPWLSGQTITAPHPDRLPGSHERITVAQRVNRPADARLIAAAPELLDLLYHALPCVEEFDKPTRPKLSAKIRAIIKQIEGEA